MSEDKIREQVRQAYAQVAREGTSCCGSQSSCCGETGAQTVSRAIGYSDTEMQSVPDGANLGLGCGNPLALEAMQPGEVVLDLGSGAGFDAFLAAARVGETGRVIGVDMTADMLARARENAAQGGYDNVEFRLGEIEHLPVVDDSVDVVISNCVINLVPDKDVAFAEAFRVLKTGGRLMVHDIVLDAELPAVIRESAAAYANCVAGAMLREDYLTAIYDAGFRNVEVRDSAQFPLDNVISDPTIKKVMQESDISTDAAVQAAKSVFSIGVFAVKPL
jgi:arsenite methyltransferase